MSLFSRCLLSCLLVCTYSHDLYAQRNQALQTISFKRSLMLPIFTRIDVQGSMRVYIRIKSDTKQPALEIIGDKETVNNLQVAVRGHILYLTRLHSYLAHPSKPLIVNLTTASIQRLDTKDKNTIDIKNLTGFVAVKASSGSNVRLNGYKIQVQRLNADRSASLILNGVPQQIQTPICISHRTLSLPFFTRLDVQGALRVYVNSNAPKQTVILSGDTQAIKNFKSNVNNKVLSLKANNHYLTHGHIPTIKINTPRILQINAIGPAHIQMNHANKDLIVNARGGGVIQLNGKQLNPQHLRIDAATRLTVNGLPYIMSKPLARYKIKINKKLKHAKSIHRFVSQTQVYPSFSGLDLEGSMNVYVTSNASEQTVSISGQADALENIKSAVKGKILHITAHTHYLLSQQQRATIRINVPSINWIKVKGSGYLAVNDLTGPLALYAQGGGHIYLQGNQFDLQHLRAEGAVSINASGIYSPSLDIQDTSTGPIGLCGHIGLHCLIYKGHCGITVDGIDTPQLAIQGNGTGMITLTGVAKTLEANLTGSTWLIANTLCVERGFIKTYAKARADVKVDQFLAALATGQSKIYYHQDPAFISGYAHDAGSILSAMPINIASRSRPSGYCY